MDRQIQASIKNVTPTSWEDYFFEQEANEYKRFLEKVLFATPTIEDDELVAITRNMIAKVGAFRQIGANFIAISKEKIDKHENR